MKNNILIFGLLVFMFQIGRAQNDKLVKKWIMSSAYNCEDKKLNWMDETFWDIEFHRNLTATISSGGGKLQVKKYYELENNKIDFDFQKFEIKKITNDTLILNKSDNKECINYLFISNEAKLKREKEIVKIYKEKSFIYKSDTVYFASKNNHPKMKNYSNYMEYFIVSFPNMNKTQGCIIQFKFIVKKNGELLDPQGSISCLKNPKKKVDQIIKKMQGKWEPMYINQRPVNSLMRVKFTHN